MSNFKTTGRSGFSVADLHYDLPGELIAQSPLARREDSRMLVVNRRQKSMQDSSICDFSELLEVGDLLVLNDTWVGYPSTWRPVWSVPASPMSSKRANSKAPRSILTRAIRPRVVASEGTRSARCRRANHDSSNSLTCSRNVLGWCPSSEGGSAASPMT